jgi:hypothetical protein
VPLAEKLVFSVPVSKAVALFKGGGLIAESNSFVPKIDCV